MNRIITIGREFGSGGRELGQKLADKLQIAYYDHEIVTELIKRTNLAEEYIRSIEERRPIPFWSITTARTFWSVPSPIIDQQISVMQKESEIIKEMASKSDCVIVGRCADYVLKDMKPFRLFIYADMDFKMERCRKRASEQEKMSDKELRQHILSVDKNRSRYYEFLTAQKWGDKANYDLCVNTSGADISRAALSVIKFSGFCDD